MNVTFEREDSLHLLLFTHYLINLSASRTKMRVTELSFNSVPKYAKGFLLVFCKGFQVEPTP